MVGGSAVAAWIQRVVSPPFHNPERICCDAKNVGKAAAIDVS
jgi:hypothetical protein